MRGAPCFYEAARRQADDAHVLVVNHALLLSDLAVGGGLLPPYEHVIIDEAHHLEEEATRQLGFELSEESVGAYLDALGGPRGLAGEAARAFGVSAPNMQARRNITERAAQRLQERVANARQAVSDLFAGLSAFLSGRDDALQRRASLRVTPSVRGNQEWTRRLELAQESVGKALREVGAAAGEVSISLEGLEGELIAQVRAELDARVEEGAQVTDRMEEFIVRAKNDVVYWLDADNQGRITLHAAPLRVDHLLKGLLFDEKRAVVLTSATLSTAGKLAPIKSLLGAQDATELLLGSPFDFQRLAQVCVPRDVPEPNSPGYDDAVAQALIDVARAARGRTLALFTSYAALRASASRVRAALEAQGIRVLAQGIDGSVAQVLEQFQVDPKALLMGTASFWEGVDLVGDQLQALVVVRLPFAVPSDPVFAARSETYEDAFNEYAVPQAVLKFRQGFGRLVRSPTDRGVVVVLDRRYISRSYGVTFRNSLPPCRMVLPTLAELGDAVEQWLRQKTAGNRR
jgi:DNA polymerase-3 subunit epsilon/ATP-dependent DNA helicase DinG